MDGLARHFGKHLPGKSNGVPQNMSGAGSLRRNLSVFSRRERRLGHRHVLASQGHCALLDKRIRQHPSSPGLVASPTSEPLRKRPRGNRKTCCDLPSSLRTLAARGAGSDSQHFRAALSQRVWRQDKMVKKRLSRHHEIQLATERGGSMGFCGLVGARSKRRYRNWPTAATRRAIIGFKPG